MAKSIVPGGKAKSMKAPKAMPMTKGTSKSSVPGGTAKSRNPMGDVNMLMKMGAMGGKPKKGMKKVAPKPSKKPW